MSLLTTLENLKKTLMPQRGSECVNSGRRDQVSSIEPIWLEWAALGGLVVVCGLAAGRSWGVGAAVAVGPDGDHTGDHHFVCLCDFVVWGAV